MASSGGLFLGCEYGMFHMSLGYVMEVTTWSKDQLGAAWHLPLLILLPSSSCPPVELPPPCVNALPVQLPPPRINALPAAPQAACRGGCKFSVSPMNKHRPWLWREPDRGAASMWYHAAVARQHAEGKPVLAAVCGI